MNRNARNRAKTWNSDFYLITLLKHFETPRLVASLPIVDSHPCFYGNDDVLNCGVTIQQGVSGDRTKPSRRLGKISPKVVRGSHHG
jgi:hypothetical protein